MSYPECTSEQIAESMIDAMVDNGGELPVPGRGCATRGSVVPVTMQSIEMTEIEILQRDYAYLHQRMREDRRDLEYKIDQLERKIEMLYRDMSIRGKGGTSI